MFSQILACLVLKYESESFASNAKDKSNKKKKKLCNRDKMNEKFYSLIPTSPDDCQNVEENVYNIEVEVQRGEDVLLG